VICPNCGLSLERDRPVERDGFVIDPRGAVSYQGRSLPISGAQRTILHALASSQHDIRNDALVARTTDGEPFSNTIQVQVCAIRKKMRVAGAPNPIINARGAYRWCAP
jgi:DNA-binding response OmpR family regulator